MDILYQSIYFINLGCFYFLAVLNNAVNIHIHGFLLIMFSLLSIDLGMELLGHTVTVTAKLFYNATLPFYIPTNNVEIFNFSAFCKCCFLSFLL